MAASLRQARGKILVHACSALCEMATHDDYRRKIAQAGGIHCIHQVLQDASLRTHTGLMQRSCLALNTLADTAELELAIGEAGCVELVLAVLEGHKMNAGVAAQACGALCAVTMSSASNRERMARAGGGGRLLAVLDVHKSNAAGAQQSETQYAKSRECLLTFTQPHCSGAAGSCCAREPCSPSPAQPAHHRGYERRRGPAARDLASLPRAAAPRSCRRLAMRGSCKPRR